MKDNIIYQEGACPINSINDLLSRKWVFGIMKDLFAGKKHFNEFKEDKPELSNVVLSSTLKYLESQGLVCKKVIEDDNKRNTEYYLTEKGKKMNRILYEMVIFGLYELEDDLRDDEFKEEIKKGYEEILL
ncbi:helix-turn-helix domain-containing protein [Methanobrevibacter sp.]|uniref:winged helix-turn-helix transcriptional regulator n=1 Tax=Methanobrevibacter sp. TaxID=66852 RepID=UPI0025D264AA|nr:helix-turn-helix domain-containing protein [Methanobrevibacter sp.]MBQ2665179.1 helix-turn-helix transcriptional regulator [Methanobrevibacter sp.]